jgi:hypothetical protein
MIVTDHELLHVKPVEQEAHERLGRVLRQRPREPHEDHDIELALSQELAPLLRQCEQGRRRRRVHDLHGMGLEGHEQAAALGSARACRDLLEHLPVAEVDPVERPDGDDRALPIVGEG